MATGIRPELIPIKKSVVDLTKGVILRTYYMRPDKLKRLINDLKTEPIKSYENKIDKYEDVKRIITSGSGDISSFSNFFPNTKSKEFGGVVKRTQVKDSIYNTNPSGYNIVRCCQLLTSFVLSIQEMYNTSFRNTLKLAMERYKFQINETNKEVIKQEKRKKSKKEEEQIEFEYPNKYIEMENNVEKSKLPENFTKSIGNTIQTNIKTKLIKYIDSNQTAKSISKFINFIHPTSNKMSLILAKLVDKNYRDNAYFIHNLILLPELYEKKGFISSLLASLIYDSYIIKGEPTAEGTEIDFEYDVYKYSVLKQIDSDKFNEIYKSYPNDKFNHSLQYLSGKNDVITMLNDKNLTNIEKSSLILLMQNDLIYKNLQKIKKFMYSETDNIELISGIFDSLLCRSDIQPDVCKYIITDLEKTKKINLFGLDTLINEVINLKIYGIEPTYNQLLLQTVVAKYLGNFYIPYDLVHKVGGLPYSPFVVNKIFPILYDKLNKELYNFSYNNSITGMEKLKELYMPVTNNEDLVDNQTFIKTDPVEILTETPITDKYVKLILPTNQIYKFVAMDGNQYYLVFDLVKHIST